MGYLEKRCRDEKFVATYLYESRTPIGKRGSKSLGAEGATWHYTWLPDAWLLPSLSVPAAAVRVPLPRHSCHLKHTTGYHDSFNCIHAPTGLRLISKPRSKPFCSHRSINFASRFAETYNRSRSSIILSVKIKFHGNSRDTRLLFVSLLEEVFITR